MLTLERMNEMVQQIVNELPPRYAVALFISDGEDCSKVSSNVRFKDLKGWMAGIIEKNEGRDDL